MSRKIRALIAVFCVVAVLMSIPAYSATLKELKRRAKKGDASSQYELALMYDEAVKWYRIAADKGNLTRKIISASSKIPNPTASDESVRRPKKEMLNLNLN